MCQVLELKLLLGFDGCSVLGPKRINCIDSNDLRAQNRPVSDNRALLRIVKRNLITQSNAMELAIIIWISK